MKAIIIYERKKAGLLKKEKKKGYPKCFGDN